MSQNKNLKMASFTIVANLGDDTDYCLNSLLSMMHKLQCTEESKLAEGKIMRYTELPLMLLQDILA